jgi:hypothetical protein
MSPSHNAYANFQYFASAPIVGNVPTVKFGDAENLLDILAQGTNYCDDGFIAATTFHTRLRGLQRILEPPDTKF